MLKQLIQVWRNNHGPILFTSGFIVAIVTSVMWRFDLIPDIRPVMRSSPTLLGNRTRTLTNIVVVSITYDENPNALVTVQFFTPSESGSDSLTPLESRSEQLEGGSKEFLVTDLARGAVAGIAYVDLNQNSQLDIDENGTANEPFAFATVKQPENAPPAARGVFEVGMEPVFVKFRLKQPNAAAGPKSDSKPDPKPDPKNLRNEKAAPRTETKG